MNLGKNEIYGDFLLHLLAKWKFKMCQKSGQKIVVIKFYVLKFILHTYNGAGAKKILHKNGHNFFICKDIWKILFFPESLNIWPTFLKLSEMLLSL